MYSSFVFDCVDGQLARYPQNFSSFGGWLDMMADRGKEFTIYAGLAAVTLGAAVIEVHVTLSREMFGPDVPASLTTAQQCQLVEGERFIEAMLSNMEDNDAAATHQNRSAVMKKLACSSAWTASERSAA
jgi:sialic acid synthase SpsE